MGGMSVWHWVIVALIVLLLFGKGRISEMMGDLGKGIKSFKAGVADDETAPTSTTQRPAPQVTQSTATPAPATPVPTVTAAVPAETAPPAGTTQP